MDRLFGLLMPVWMLASVVLFFVTLAAYYAGTETWFGWGFWLSFGVMLVAFFFQGLGAIFISIVGFYGMWRGWGWAWWQALLATFPVLGLAAAIMIGGGVASGIGRIADRARGRSAR